MSSFSSLDDVLAFNDDDNSELPMLCWPYDEFDSKGFVGVLIFEMVWIFGCVDIV